ncbi:MAG TPA: peptidoglycan DD-metalloendopeptidase family protein [Leptolyngbyaceae cyanobacterium]
MKNTTLSRSILAIASLLAAAVPVNMGSAQAQNFETFSVNGGMALNTNNNFRRIDGQPRMGIWQHNVSDPDQQFQRLRQPDGTFLLKHRSTGKCLNAYRRFVGAEVNVWDCNSNDSDQKFVLTSLSSSVWQIKRSGTNLCVDSPTRQNGGIIHLQDCNANNGNQRWQSSLQTPPVQSGNLNIRPSQQYFRGTNLRTINGYRLSFQSDGNLVLYTPSNSAIWATGTVGNSAGKLAIQSDGNIVLYDNSNRPMWATNTAGNPGAFLAVQTDGNLVVYTQDGSRPLFATNTAGGVRTVFNAAEIWRSRGTYLPNLGSLNDTQWEDTINTGRAIQAINNNPNSDLGKLYRDLSNDLFDRYFPITGCYICDDYYKATGGNYGWHGGIDIGSPMGTPVKSIVNGTVEVANLNSSGWLSIKGDDGKFYIYGHLDTFSRNIIAGAKVTKGMQLGTTGARGVNNRNAFSPHLHFEVSRVPYGALQRTAPTNKQGFRERSYNPLKTYWQIRNGQ